jgi:hypothetical protein
MPTGTLAGRDASKGKESEDEDEKLVREAKKLCVHEVREV